MSRSDEWSPTSRRRIGLQKSGKIAGTITDDGKENDSRTRDLSRRKVCASGFGQFVFADDVGFRDATRGNARRKLRQRNEFTPEAAAQSPRRPSQ
jgi:hypothetical protein